MIATDRNVESAALTGVSETALMTLNGRAHPGPPDAIIDDPMAIRLRDAFTTTYGVDYSKFGRRGRRWRFAFTGGRRVHHRIPAHPSEATIVALAEGFQTSFWRLDKAVPDARFRWVSVDLPPVIELREQLLPASDRITNIGQSALDYSWMDRIDTSEGVASSPPKAC